MDIQNRPCPRGASAYTWQRGDTLAALALRNGTTEQAIRLANEGLNFDAILPGDTVCIPPQQLTCVSGERYTVRRGETFAGIAEAFGLSTLELSERNPYVDPANLTPGQVLCVPFASPPPIRPPVNQPPVNQPPVSRPPNCAPYCATCPRGYIGGTVQVGQGLIDLLVRYDVSYQAFQLANPALNVEQLTPGQAFCVPASEPRRLCEVGGRSYVLEQSDNLRIVAQRFGTTQTQLLRLNPTLAPSDFIPGRVVCIP